MCPRSCTLCRAKWFRTLWCAVGTNIQGYIPYSAIIWYFWSISNILFPLLWFYNQNNFHAISINLTSNDLICSHLFRIHVITAAAVAAPTITIPAAMMTIKTVGVIILVSSTVDFEPSTGFDLKSTSSIFDNWPLKWRYKWSEYFVTFSPFTHVETFELIKKWFEISKICCHLKLNTCSEFLTIPLVIKFLLYCKQYKSMHSKE